MLAGFVSQSWLLTKVEVKTQETTVVSQCNSVCKGHLNGGKKCSQTKA